jgi:hypothetical protein
MLTHNYVLSSNIVPPNQIQEEMTSQTMYDPLHQIMQELEQEKTLNNKLLTKLNEDKSFTTDIITKLEQEITFNSILTSKLEQERKFNAELRTKIIQYNKCLICFTNDISKCCVPCGHTYCNNCIINNNYCHMCRTPIQQKINIYI